MYQDTSNVMHFVTSLDKSLHLYAVTDTIARRILLTFWKSAPTTPLNAQQSIQRFLLSAWIIQ